MIELIDTEGNIIFVNIRHIAVIFTIIIGNSVPHTIVGLTSGKEFQVEEIPEEILSLIKEVENPV